MEKVYSALCSSGWKSGELITISLLGDTCKYVVLQDGIAAKFPEVSYVHPTWDNNEFDDFSSALAYMKKWLGFSYPIPSGTIDPKGFSFTYNGSNTMSVVIKHKE